MKITNIYRYQSNYKYPTPLMQNFTSSNDFENEYNNMVGNFERNPRAFKRNVYQLGLFIDNKFPILDDNSIGIIDKMALDIEKLVSNISSSNNVNVKNIIYSAILKNIRPEDIVSGRVSPNKYMEILNKSIHSYYEQPVGDFLDYRHIHGRMVSHQKICKKLESMNVGLPKDYKLMRWSIDNQLDLLGILEKIMNQFELVNKNFVTPIYREQVVDTGLNSIEKVKSFFSYEVYGLLSRINAELKHQSLLKNKNKEHIANLVEYANEYAYRVNTNSREIGGIYSILANINRLGAKILK